MCSAAECEKQGLLMKIKKIILSASLLCTAFFATEAFSSIDGKYQCKHPEKDISEEVVIKHVEGNHYTLDWAVKQAKTMEIMRSGFSNLFVVGDKGLSHWKKTADRNDDRMGISELSFQGDLIKVEVHAWTLTKNSNIEHEQFSMLCHKM